MKNIETEEDIDSLVGLNFEQLLQRMVNQADAIRTGAVRVGNGEPYRGDEERLTGASSFAKALATRLKTEHVHGEIKAVMVAVKAAVNTREREPFIDLPEEIPEIDPATFQALKELSETPKITFADHAKALQEEVRLARVEAALDFLLKRRTKSKEEVVNESLEVSMANLPEGMAFTTPLYDALVGSLEGLFSGALGFTPEADVVLQAEQAAHIAGFRDDLRTLTLTLADVAALASDDRQRQHEELLSQSAAHFETNREREDRATANILAALQSIASSFQQRG